MLDKINNYINAVSLYLQVETIEVYGLSVTKLAVGVFFGVLLLALLAVRGPHLWAKVAATLVLAPLIMLGVLVALSDQLSYAKQLPIEWLEQQKNLVVVGEPVLRPPNKIEIPLDIRGETRLFWFPWSEKLEKSLRTARDARRRSQGNGQLLFRFQRSIEKDQGPEFYFMPWPAPPSKDEEDIPPALESPSQRFKGKVR